MTPLDLLLTNPRTGEKIRCTEDDIHVQIAEDSLVSLATPMGKARELLLNTVELKEVKTEVGQ